MEKFSFRTWVSIITTIILLGVIYFAWPEISKAWNLLGSVNLWVLSLLVPVQILSYYATGAIMFSYLRRKGNIKNISHWGMTRIALELNFVNHVIPSGGAVGFSYLPWVLKGHGVSASRATSAQIIRYALTFVTFVLLLVVAMIILTVTDHIGRVIVIFGSALAVLAVAAMILMIWLLNSRRRIDKFSAGLEKFVNGVVGFFTAGRKKDILKNHVLVEFFDGIYDDYFSIKKDRKILFVPFLWSVFANVLDAALLWIAFAALGFYVDPSILLISFGLSSIAGAITVTPGGAGVYEAVTVAFLAASGLSADAAIAGTLLSRVILVLGTILFGYFFYQATVLKHGKIPVKANE